LLGKSSTKILGSQRTILALLKDEDIDEGSEYDMATRINFVPTIL